MNKTIGRIFRLAAITGLVVLGGACQGNAAEAKDRAPDRPDRPEARQRQSGERPEQFMHQLGGRVERLEQRMNQMAERQEQFLRRMPGRMERPGQPVPGVPGAPGAMRKSAMPAREGAPAMMPPPWRAMAMAGGKGVPPMMAPVKAVGDFLKLVLLSWLLCNILMAVWIFMDIRRRGEGPAIFVAMALFAGIPAAIIYALVRIGDCQAATVRKPESRPAAADDKAVQA